MIILKGFGKNAITTITTIDKFSLGMHCSRAYWEQTSLYIYIQNIIYKKVVFVRLLHSSKNKAVDYDI